MARKSQRLTHSIGAGHKREGSSSVTVSESKRTKARPMVDDDDGDQLPDSSSPSDEDSDFDTGHEDPDVSEDDDDLVSEDNQDEPVAKKGRKSRPSGTGIVTELKTVVIKKIKARPAGDIPYTDDTIHPNTLLFLEELRAHNNRQWLKMNDAIFRQAEQDWYSFLEKLTERLTQIDDTVPELPVKDLTFRIYRDIRFSKDPTPYKTHFSAAWSRTGRKGDYAAYYLQIGRQENFFGCGLWNPDAAATAAMRREFDRHPERIKRVLMSDEVRENFLDGASNNEASVIKAFSKSNSKNALKTRPKGFNQDHPEIALLKLRSFTLGAKLDDEQILGLNGPTKIHELMTWVKPFVTYLNSVVRPDEPGRESEDGSGADSDDEGTDGNESA